MSVVLGREDKRPPSHLQQILTKHGGLNQFGEPNIRLVWSESRLTWTCGEWSDWDGDRLVRRVVEARLHPKYWYLAPAWVFEKWLPPTFYGTRDDWKAAYEEQASGQTIEALGPYPSRGDYEYVEHIEGAVDPFVAEWTVRAIKATEALAQATNDLELKAAKEYADQAQALRSKALMGEAIDDAWPAFSNVPKAVYDSTKQAYWQKEA